MNRMKTMSLSTLFFLGTLGLGSAYAAPASAPITRGATEITGCLQQGPDAKEYLIQASDGTKWGVNEDRDMMLNDYVGKTVTIAGDHIRPTAAERTDGGASRYLLARDVVVESQGCQK